MGSLLFAKLFSRNLNVYTYLIMYLLACPTAIHWPPTVNHSSNDQLLDRCVVFWIFLYGFLRIKWTQPLVKTSSHESLVVTFFWSEYFLSLNYSYGICLYIKHICLVWPNAAVNNYFFDPTKILVPRKKGIRSPVERSRKYVPRNFPLCPSTNN